MPVTPPPGQPPLRRGDRGPEVSALRALLATVTGRDGSAAGGRHSDAAVFDDELENAVREFQQGRGLLADGVVGRQTALQLEGARWHLGDRMLMHIPGHLMRGDDVAALQERLVVLGVHAGPVDGLYGPDTEDAVRELQRGLGLDPDGRFGPEALQAVLRLSRAVDGGDAWALRTQSDVDVAGKSLAGKVIVLDPSSGDSGFGAGDPIDVSYGQVEAEVCFDVAARIADRLAAVGAKTGLTRCADEAPELAERVDVAESLGAQLVISLHCDTHASPQAAGVTTYYWGGRRVGQHSAVGRKLAALIQRELVARTGVVDLRTHPGSFDIVRMTRMPAVLVGLGYLTNPGDAERLGDPRFRDTVAEAVVVAVQRLYLGEDDAARTGTLQLEDVLANAGLTTEPTVDAE